MEEYLQVSKVINWQHPQILELAKNLAAQHNDQEEIAKACFEWVRDEVHHSMDYKKTRIVQDLRTHRTDVGGIHEFPLRRNQVFGRILRKSYSNLVTCIASDVLEYQTGLCFAKSHLLAALLRANGIPTGFCYQRLDFDGKGNRYCLHGYNAIYLEKYAQEISHNNGWFRIDARGNREDINVQFNPPQEQLAYQANGVGEEELEGIFSEPLAVVIDALQGFSNLDDLLPHFPDIRNKK